MNRVKKLFNNIILIFVLVGTLFCGLAFYGLANKKSNNTSAVSIYEEITNSLPEYFSPETDNAIAGNDNNDSLFLIDTNGKVDIEVTDKDQQVERTATVDGIEKIYKNYAYFPDKNDKTKFYYFKFENSLSLYYNVTNKDIAENLDPEKNLLNGIPFSNYVSTYIKYQLNEDGTIAKDEDGNNIVEEESFRIDQYDLIPQKFKMAFALDTTKDKPSFGKDENSHVVTLDNEGCYTLFIPYSYYYSEDGGNTFTETQSAQIKYTFMLFNSSTYLNVANNLPNTTMSDFVQSSSLINNQSHSRYYFYNYASKDSSSSAVANGEAQLPTYTFNPSLYELSVVYTDINDVVQSATFKLDYNAQTGKNELHAYDASGNLTEIPVYYNYDESTSNLATLTFNDLGSYNISFNFIYKEADKTFNLPLTALDQRLYIYGYQSFYTTQEKDPITNETLSKELKKVNEATSTFRNSADITSVLSSKINMPAQHSANPTDADEIKAQIENNISKLQEIKPVSTNQTPIKFRANSNVTLQTSGVSAYYAVTFDNDGNPTIGSKTPYTGDNLKDAGTYLVITVYTYRDFLSTSGTQQSNFYHYQIFYLTITNTTPTVTVKAVTGEVDNDNNAIFKNLYAGDYTNKSVYIIDDSTNSEYDANVTITLTARNYMNTNSQNDYFFQNEDIKNFVDGFTYARGITYYPNLGVRFGINDPAKKDFDGKAGLYIDASETADNPYHNAEFTIYIRSASSQEASSRTFTIDTNPIGKVSAKSATYSTSSDYTLSLNPIDGNKTNQPLAFYWNEKNSGAPTYGYFKYYPLKDVEYYGNNQSTTSRILRTMIERNDIIPVNAVLDLNSQDAGWTRYTNSLYYSESSKIPATYVRSSAGLYILEVYDDAGNSTFEVYLLDNTSPFFVKRTVDSELNDSYSLITGTETITVSEDTTVSIHWADKKGIYIRQPANTSDIYKNYQNDGLGDLSNQIQTVVENFLNSNKQAINNISGISSNDTANIPNYNGDYLAINIIDEAWIKEIINKTTGQVITEYSPFNATSYTIDFFKTDEDGNQVANEGPYKFLIRDSSNTKLDPNHGKESFLNAPSAYATIVVSSDQSKLQFIINNDTDNPVTQSGYSLAQKFYLNADGELVKNNPEQNLATAGNKAYKYSYYNPIKTTLPLSISFVPKTKNSASVMESLWLEYYPYVKANQNVTMQDHDNGTFTAKTYYRTLSNTPTRSFPIFELSTENEGLLEDTVMTYNISFSGTDIADEGKYVITRRYSDKDSTGLDQYDYFERTLTLIVDRSNIISPLTQISNGDNKSFESIVGGDILIQVYSESDQSSISLALPDYNPTTGLNSGSLYTSQNMTEESLISTALTSNKLPLSVRIPKYKYTTYNQYDRNTNSYTSNTNNKLSYFGDFAINEEQESSSSSVRVFRVYTELAYDQANNLDTERSILIGQYDTRLDAEDAVSKLQQNASIDVYELAAKICFKPASTLSDGRTWKWYRTNKSTTNNFLNFYETTGEWVAPTANAKLLESFSEVGQYVITIYQASNQNQESEGNAAFNMLYKVQFEITNPTPDFSVLNSNTNTGLNSVTEDGLSTYYTNTNLLRVQWEDPSDEFLAKIEKTSISIITVNDRTQNEYSISLGEIQQIKNSNIFYFDIDLQKRFESNDIDLQKRFESNFWKNGNSLSISMRYEGYPAEPRYTVTKQIKIDYTAPVETLATLMQNLSSSASMFDRIYQERNMRVLYDYTEKQIDTTDVNVWNNNANLTNLMENVSYSYTPGSGNFRHYAYPVNRSFFNTVYSKLTDPQNRFTNTQELYFKSIDKSASEFLTNYTQTNNGSFSPANGYLSLKNVFASLDNDGYLVSDTYYEVVELDTAGNMVVYIVYYNNNNQNDTAISYTNSALQEKPDADKVKTISNKEITDGFNIYSKTGFELQELNFNSDAWGIYKTRINRIDRTFMLSPWLFTDGMIYELIGNNFVQTRISDIFGNVKTSTEKFTISISDRMAGDLKNIYVSIMDTTLTTTKYSDENANGKFAILEIATPTYEEVVSMTPTTFPVRMTISNYDGNGWNSSMLLTNGSVPDGNPNTWSSFNQGNYLAFSYDLSRRQLIISIRIDNVYNRKFKYEIEDNFGGITTIIQLVDEETCEEVISESNSPIYSTTESGDNGVTYLSANDLTFQYNNLIYSAEVVKVIESGREIVETVRAELKPGSRNISQIKLRANSLNYDKTYIIEIQDMDNPGTVIRTVNLRIYNRLPILTTSLSGNNSNRYIRFFDKNGNIIETTDNVPSVTVEFNGRVLTSSATSITTFSNNVTTRFDNGQNLATQAELTYNDQYTYSTYISEDGKNWTNINEEYAIGHVISGTGTYYILCAYDHENYFKDVYKLYMVNILSSSSISYYFNVDGMPATARRNFNYTVKDTGEVITTVYMLNVNYEDKDARVSIQANPELDAKIDNIRLVTDSNSGRANVRVEIYRYHSNITTDATFAVVYIGENSNILNKLTYENALGSNVDLLQIDNPANPSNIVALADDTMFNQLKISWNNYYGIQENTINVEVEKKWIDENQNETWVKVNTTVYGDDRTSFIYLTRAGAYRLKFEDSCEKPNTHLFGARSDVINITFLSSVPFTVTYTDPAQEKEVTSEPINRAIYNGSVRLSLTDPNEYFASGYPIIHVMKDGKEYTGFTNQGIYNYIFSENGYYSVYFEAKTIDQQDIRIENYVFSIINANESRFAFEYSTFSKYYVKSIIKDGIDVTKKFVDIIDDNKVTIGDDQYLTNLQISFFDEKTGAGRYVITIETGEQTYSTAATSFTFAFRINLATPPITVGLEEGSSTTKTISVSFNARHLYETVGDCIVRIPGHSPIIINAENLDTETITREISEIGTNYVQVLSMSGNLLYSYKVTRNKPLNLWSIFAIVISIVVVAIIIFVTIKLRKRLKVK